MNENLFNILPDFCIIFKPERGSWEETASVEVKHMKEIVMQLNFPYSYLHNNQWV